MAKEPVVVVYASNQVPKDELNFKAFLECVARGAWKDFKTTNASTVGKGLKFGAGIVGAAPVAKATGTQTPVAWLFRRFGALPLEFTSNGVIQVHNLSLARRAVHMLKAAGIKFVLVTLAYEGGVMVGSIINQFLSEETQNAIGGTLDGIINQNGWQDLWKHPFGIGM